MNINDISLYIFRIYMFVCVCLSLSLSLAQPVFKSKVGHSFWCLQEAILWFQEAASPEFGKVSGEKPKKSLNGEHRPSIRRVWKDKVKACVGDLFSGSRSRAQTRPSGCWWIGFVCRWDRSGMWASGVRAWEQGGFEWRSRLRWGLEGVLCGLREIRALSGARGSGDLSALGVAARELEDESAFCMVFEN